MRRTNKQTCSNCGSLARVARGDYKFTESGLSNVTLQDIDVIRCDECGNEDPIIPNATGLMRVIAAALILKPYRLVGEEVRFLRKHAGKTLDEFGQWLKVDRATVSRWENDQQNIGEQSDQLIRLVAVELGDDVLRKQIHATLQQLLKTSDKTQKVPIRIDATNMSYAYAA